MNLIASDIEWLPTNCKKVKKKIEKKKKSENLFGYQEMLWKLKENDKIGI